MIPVKGSAHGKVIVISLLGKFFPMQLKESPYGFRRDTALLDALIEPDDIFVLVRQERPFGCHIEGDHTGTEKRLNLSPLPVPLDRGADKGDKLCLDALALDGWHNNFPLFHAEASSLLLSPAAGNVILQATCA